MLSRAVYQFFGVGAGTRHYLSSEHRPYICYGVSTIWNTAAFGEFKGLDTMPTPPQFALPQTAVALYFTLVEWHTMRERHKDLPYMYFAPYSASVLTGGKFRATAPALKCRPFLIDLGASYVRGAGAAAKTFGVGFDFDLVPADAANLARAGLKLPTDAR